MLAAGSQALPWDLAFPEVFRPDGADASQGGFDAVLSNPPWDIMQPNTAEFLAGFDLAILDAASRREAHAIRDRLLADPGVADAWRDYQAEFGRQQRWWKGFTSIRDMVRMAVSWAESSIFIACSRNEWFGVAIARMARSGWWFHPRSMPMRARRASASSICSRHSSEQCLSFENRKSAVRYPRAIQIRSGRCTAPWSDADGPVQLLSG